jgi:carboxyl-terminal processing protease
MDGRGIEPDRLVSAGSESELEQALDRRAAFFFFANHFAAEHDATPPDFTVSDAVLADFKAWLDEQDFTYRTDAERAVEALETDLTRIGYESADDEMQALRTAVMEEKNADFRRFELDLKERLRSEILARYYGESAQIEASFGHDRQILEAVELLNDARSYRSVLSPN